MINLIGVIPPVEHMLRQPDAHVHLYGKQPRPGRKLGHVTFRSDDARQLRLRAEKFRAELLAMSKQKPHPAGALFYED
jgi:5-(carboxyamino)imidazole ribonucleotide synthase